MLVKYVGQCIVFFPSPSMYFIICGHPKLKIVSLITNPHVVPVRPSFIFWTQIKIFMIKSESFLFLYISIKVLVL